MKVRQCFWRGWCFLQTESLEEGQARDFKLSTQSSESADQVFLRLLGHAAVAPAASGRARYSPLELADMQKTKTRADTPRDKPAIAFGVRSHWLAAPVYIRRLCLELWRWKHRGTGA